MLWLLYESKKVKTILLAALVLLSMVCMFFHEAFAPSREYPWDCMVEHIFTGTLLPFCLPEGVEGHRFFRSWRNEPGF